MSGKKKPGAGASKPKPKIKGGAKPKAKATRRSSRSPPKVTVKDEEGRELIECTIVNAPPPRVPKKTARDEDLQGVGASIRRLSVNDPGASGAPGSSGASGSRVRPKPYPVMFDGPVPRSIEDVDKAERLHKRRYCGHLFDGTVEFGKDQDGLQECMLIELPDLLPLDRDQVLKWKASEQQRIREGKPPVDYESDYEGMTDEEKKQVVECCTPADLDGTEAGKIRVYEDGFVEYVCGGVRFEVTEGTDVIDRQDIYVANMNKDGVDSAGNECNIALYPMMTVKHRLVCSPIIDDLI